MKDIYIITASGFFPAHKKISRDIRHALEKEYHITVRDIKSYEDMQFFLDTVDSENCQLLINLDMTGYQVSMAANIAQINTLPMNCINYITQPLELFSVFFKNNFSYLASFVFCSKDNYNKVRAQYPELWHVDCCEDIKSLVRYIENLDWRYGGG